jgi:hypothetical protein
MKIIEYFILARNGQTASCEDRISPFPFVAVIDGETSKTDWRLQGQTSGQICARIVAAVLSEESSLALSAREVVNEMTRRVQAFYQEHDLLATVQQSPENRLTASFVAYHPLHREIWMVGDCQCLIDDRLIVNKKLVDEVNSAARALFLASELALGCTVEELRERDSGREYILPLLKRQMVFQNNPAAGKFWFPVIDGFPVPDEGIRVIPLPQETRSLVLASDGYPFLKPTLAASEQALYALLDADPLLFQEYQATKGMAEGMVSFDDRAYIRIGLDCTEN